MVATLKKFGNTQALVINKTLREQMGIDESTPLEIRIDHGNLIVSPSRVGIGPERLQELIGEVREQYGDMLKRLA